MTPFIFLHVPKTAGTTLRAIIERQYAPEEVYTVYDGAEDHHSQEELKALSPEAQKSIKAYCGHVSFGVHRHLEQRPRYVTILRDPVERVISYYHHVMTLIPRWKSQPISLVKFIQGRKDIQVDNLQTRLLSGVEKPFNGCSDDMLWKAIENIETQFHFVGLSEQFDESLQFIAEHFGWESPYYVRENEGINRPPRDYYSELEMNVVRNHNRLDAILVSYVKKSLLRRIHAADHTYNERLAQFRSQNEAAKQRLSARAVWS